MICKNYIKYDYSSNVFDIFLVIIHGINVKMVKRKNLHFAFCFDIFDLKGR